MLAGPRTPRLLSMTVDEAVAFGVFLGQDDELVVVGYRRLSAM